MLLFGSPSSACQCRARSKRSGEQCRKAAMKGKTVCLAHGGRST
ncbi:MAG: HGGxSTG domain-containing protein, partial [Steroidobacteraceae bacterium]